MAIQHQITRNFRRAGETVTSVVTQSGTNEPNLDTSVATGSTNLAVAYAYTISGLLSVFLLSDQPVTIKVNSSGSPDQTIALLAGVAVEWQSGDLGACPLTHDSTTWYVTNASGKTANIKSRLLK
jgi:hypothetical protein